MEHHLGSEEEQCSDSKVQIRNCTVLFSSAANILSNLIREKKMKFFVLYVFDGVIMDGRPIFWVVDAGVAGIHHD